MNCFTFSAFSLSKLNRILNHDKFDNKGAKPIIGKFSLLEVVSSINIGSILLLPTEKEEEFQRQATY